jgi:hypothetical protein
MKICLACNTKKDESEFSRHKNKTDSRQSQCKMCCNKKHREYYKENRVWMRKDIQKRREDRIARNYTWFLNFLLKNPCIDCGAKDVLVLDMDHVRGRKITDVSNLVSDGCSLKSIKKEIKKCVVRCANCHRRSTAIRSRTWRWKISKTLRNLC